LSFISETPSVAWLIYHVECFCPINSQVLVQHLTILAPISSPNTDGIDPGMLFSLVQLAVLDCLNSFFVFIVVLVYALFSTFSSWPLCLLKESSSDILGPCSCFNKTINLDQGKP